jgi:hypothetical protein
MAPDADAGKAGGNRSDPFAPLTSELLPAGDGPSICMAGLAAAANPIIAGCSIPSASTPCCSTSAAPAAADPRAAATITRCRI